MDMERTGKLLKELRKEKEMTQEQLAEQLGVSSRTVSRWETGSNMPDLSVLIELADLYHVDIRELIDGERKSENVNQETKDTLVKAADYAEQEKKCLKKKMLDMMGGVLLLLMFNSLLWYLGYHGKPYQNLTEFTMGATIAVLVLNMLYLSGKLDKLRKAKLRWFKKEEK